MTQTISKNNVPIRLPEERWFHIVRHHNDLAGYYDDVLNTIMNPDIILKGYKRYSSEKNKDQNRS